VTGSRIYRDYHAKCFVLIGPPASGKSTWRAKNLNSMFLTNDTPEPCSVVISGDDLIEAEMAVTGDSYPVVFARHDFKEQKRVLRNRFTQAIEEGRDIVIDRTNLTVKGRRSFLASLPQTYEKVAVLFDLPETVLFERLERRGLETGKVIPRKVVEDMIASYQPPAPGEFDRIIRN
jgi:predicted kinase